MKKLILFLFITGLSLSVHGQVKGPDRIIGQYTGEQKKEMAHGKGKSIGTDTYEGEFQKGFPDGTGVYTFGSDVELAGAKYTKGDRYEGEFQKGRFEGKGKIIFKDTTKVGISGYWDNDKYIGRTKFGYEVVKKENIARIVILKNGTALNKIEVKGLNDIVEVGVKNIEFDGTNTYTDIPASKFPFLMKIKGTVPSTGAKAQLIVLFETPGIWSVNIDTN